MEKIIIAMPKGTLYSLKNTTCPKAIAAVMAACIALINMKPFRNLKKANCFRLQSFQANPNKIAGIFVPFPQ